MSVGVDLQQRLDYLIERLRSTYDGFGHSSGRPYTYFLYHPSHESQMRRLVNEQLISDAQLTFHAMDVLHITIDSLAGKEDIIRNVAPSISDWSYYGSSSQKIKCLVDVGCRL